MPPLSEASRVQSVDRAADLLRAVAAARSSESTAAELAAATGLNRATAWRILRTMEARGLVALDPVTRSFTIGTTIVDLARSAPTDTLRSRAHRVLRELCLQTRETIALALVEEDGFRYVEEVYPPGSTEESWVGVIAGPDHATSTGKVYLAFVPDSFLAPDQLHRYTDSTITDPKVLDEELAVVRSQGYALCRGEFEADVWGVSAPLLAPDHTLIGVLSCWGPASRGEPDRFAALGSMVREAARGIITK